MEYSTNYDIGDRKRPNGINEDSVSISVFEQGHREGVTPDGDGGPTNRSAAAFALADGAGGHDAGDVASYIATTVVCERLSGVAARVARSDPGAFDVDLGDAVTPDRPSDEELEEAIRTAIVAAHREIVRYTAENDTRAYTTVVAGVCVDGRLHYGWVGDSRAYVVNEATGEAALLTKDHGVVEQLRDRGEIDDVAAHVHPRGNEITRALGGTGDEDPQTASVAVDTDTVPVFAEDVVLVTSDGLIDAQTNAHSLYDQYVETGRTAATADTIRDAVVTDAEIRDVVLDADSLDGAAAELITLANERGGKDNLSTVLLRDSTLDPTPSGGLPVRAVDADPPVEDRETVIRVDR